MLLLKSASTREKKCVERENEKKKRLLVFNFHHENVCSYCISICEVKRPEIVRTILYIYIIYTIYM